MAWRIRGGSSTSASIVSMRRSASWPALRMRVDCCLASETKRAISFALKVTGIDRTSAVASTVAERGRSREQWERRACPYPAPVGIAPPFQDKPGPFSESY
jgi:hypothetical protein